MIDDELAVGRALASYRTPNVSPDLAERIVGRIGRARRVRNAVVALGVVAVAASAVVMLRSGSAASSGGARVTERSTLHVGERAIAVAEPSADLRWEVSGDGATRVEQYAGRVFYRVEPGGPFIVETPAGTIAVTGTCFHVEVEPMSVSRQHVLGGALGAVAAAVVVVAVYEGGVRVVNANGAVAVAPGERATIEPGGAPTRSSPESGSMTASARLRQLGADASRADLVAQNEEIREQLALAAGKSEHLEKQLAELRNSGKAPASHVDPTPDQLAAWAKNCEVHLDAPDVFGVSPTKISAKDAADWGIAKSEIPGIEAALADLHGKAREEIREIYIAATNNVAGADELTANGMISEILEKALPVDKLRTRERLSRERAGLQAPPRLQDMSPYERAMRLILRLGHDLERSLGDAFGARRAHELRTRYNSWPGWQMHSSGCEESQH